MLSKIVIFGNSGSGKSTLAKHLAVEGQLAHLDLDTIAWKKAEVIERESLLVSSQVINTFLTEHNHWVIEGCYADLLEIVMAEADKVIFLNLPVATCIENAKNRPWEAHKYKSKAAQDKNLAMLIDWISHYTTREDTFSKTAHKKLFDTFKGDKVMYVSNNRCKE